MGDRVVVLRDGRLQQVGTPTELYERPVNTFVAGFIGSPAINLLDGVPVRDGRATIAHSLQVPVAASTPAGEGVTVGIRPEGVEPADADPDSLTDRLTVRVDRVERMGSEIFAYVHPVDLGVATARAEHLIVRLDKRHDVQEGRELALRVHLDEVLVFDPDGHAVRRG